MADDYTMAGGAQAFNAMMERADFFDGMKESPCRGCQHFKNGVERKICREEDDCLLNWQREPIDFYRANARARIPENWKKETVCKWPGCEKKVNRGYCQPHGSKVRRREISFYRKFGRQPPENYLHLDFDGRILCKLCKDLVQRYYEQYGEMP